MRSPENMNIVMIDITNSCIHRCSNCTRFCGNHRKPFFMDFEAFKNAVDSMEDFPGIVGLIGGEPTLHPDFDRMIRYYRSKIAEPKEFSPMIVPVKELSWLHCTVKYMRGKKRGLFSSFGPGYRKHSELIQDTFPYQSLNDHCEINNHQAIMVTRKELGFADEEWEKLRDNCWIQNLWSASITPKGAFFCEIAASLDMLFNGAGGWKVEPGWWKRKPEDFKDQLHWCEFCSVALPVPTIPANEQKDIVSPVMLEKLKAVDSPRVKAGNFVLLDPAKYNKEEFGHKRNPIWYLPDEKGDLARVSDTNEFLKVGRFDICLRSGEPPANSEFNFISLHQFNNLEFKEWLLVVDSADRLDPDFLNEIKLCILNPGVIYRHGSTWFLNRNSEALRGQTVFPADPFSLWQKKKQYEFRHFPCVGTLDWFDKMSIIYQQLRNRLAPLRLL
jgi:hypothetical protein